MFRKFTALSVLALVLVLLPTSTVLAQTETTLNLPPGIAELAQPYLEAMMQRMQQMDMSPEQMQMMMADMQGMADQLPPGIFLQVLQLMSQLEMNDMMALHQQIHQGELFLKTPGQILILIKGLIS